MSPELPFKFPLSRGQAATLACLLEVTAPKVGNVHRGADFENLTFTDFAVSAVAIGPVIESTRERGVGPAVLAGVQATRQVVDTNTNLGMLLLLAPLAAVAEGGAWQAGISQVLSSLTPEDSAAAYAAIRLAQPGGLGKVESHDVADRAPADLLAAMRLAAERDLIARQYVENFALVFQASDRLVELRGSGLHLSEAIVRSHVELIASEGDSLILRKSGREIAARAQSFAAAVVQAGAPRSDDYYAALADFDFWLRAHGNQRNPGATADLLAAALFVGLRDGRIQPPFR